MTTDEIRRHRAELIDMMGVIRTELHEFVDQAEKREKSAAKEAADRARRFKASTTVLAVVLLAALGAIGLVWRYSSDVEELARCQAHASQESREGLAARSRAADESTGAELTFLDATEKIILGTPQSATQEQRDAGRQEYLRAVQLKRESLLASQRTRADNPVVPDSGC